MTLDEALRRKPIIYDTIEREEVVSFIKRIYDELEPKSCEGCIHHKAYNGNFPLSCCECSRFYSDNFEEMKK